MTILVPEERLPTSAASRPDPSSSKSAGRASEAKGKGSMICAERREISVSCSHHAGVVEGRSKNSGSLTGTVTVRFQ